MKTAPFFVCRCERFAGCIHEVCYLRPDPARNQFLCGPCNRRRLLDMARQLAEGK